MGGLGVIFFGFGFFGGFFFFFFFFFLVAGYFNEF